MVVQASIGLIETYFIGRLGTVLGEAGINIGTFHLGRAKAGGEAVLLLSVDEPVGAEVIARVASEGFDLLDAPPQRLNAKDTPVPYHPNLWAAHRPTARSIAAAARNLLRL